MTRVPGCVFCEIVDGAAPATVVRETVSSLFIVPLGPVVQGHLLVIPKDHVDNAAEWPALTGEVMRCAATWGQERSESFNLITSQGREATQSVFHLHAHYIPRSANDGLLLPWGDNARHVV